MKIEIYKSINHGGELDGLVCTYENVHIETDTFKRAGDYRFDRVENGVMHMVYEPCEGRSERGDTNEKL